MKTFYCPCRQHGADTMQCTEADLCAEEMLSAVPVALDPDGNLAGPEFGDGPEFEGWSERSKAAEL